MKMHTPLDSYPLWQATLARQGDALDAPREVLRQSFLSFRGRVADLVSTLGSELPGLTVHDITHLDALWRVAAEIAGEGYPINAAEAYVLGGAFLLHDAAHVLAAYPGGLAEIKQTVQWQDLVAQRRAGLEPSAGSSDEKAIIFQVLRHLHAEQAHQLASTSWRIAGNDESLFLIEQQELRAYYGDLIGQVAASHHWAPEKLVAEFSHRHLSCPSLLLPANWEVDALKVAFLLRTADAAHLDSQRAPWFLFALRQPQGISAEHWRFQAKMGQPTRTINGELRLTSGSAFITSERSSWWLALDAARMVDKELQSARVILEEEGRQPFAATRVLGVESAYAFARQLPVRGWEPLDVAPRIGNVPQLIASLGGAALYGDSYSAPLRELLQNGLDAVNALRALGGAAAEEGQIHVTVQPADEVNWWLEVTDTGIGMSRHVLSNVLLDFGTSLWASDLMREELPGLARSNFRPIGKFGIGFFSVFMLGSEVRVTTRRYEAVKDESKLNWQLRFDDGLSSRPALIQPSPDEILPRSGTRVSVKITDAKLESMLDSIVQRSAFDGAFASAFSEIFGELKKDVDPEKRDNMLAWLVGSICPTSSVEIRTKIGKGSTFLVALPNDWKTMPAKNLLNRVGGSGDQLFPITSEEGALLGRVALAERSYDSRPGSIVYQSVVSGQLVGLDGVIQARENNIDARRTQAFPGGSVGAWVRWAMRVLDGSDKLSRQQCLRLHPLIPEMDLAVWSTGEVVMTLAQVMDLIGSAEEVVLHQGDISHENADDISADNFSLRFKVSDSLVCYPQLVPQQNVWTIRNFSEGREAFPWFTGVTPILYLRRFEEALNARWEAFDTEDLDGHVVGLVDGTEICRSATRYFKRASQ